MISAKPFTVALATLLLTGCGQYLGDYSVEEVHLVPDTPPSREGSPSPSYGQYLEIRVASKTNLTSIGQTVDAVYVDADFCPLRNRNGLIAFGPYSDEKQDLGLPRDANALKVGRTDSTDTAYMWLSLTGRSGSLNPDNFNCQPTTCR